MHLRPGTGTSRVGHELDSLLGRGDPERSQLAEERLEWTRRARLTGQEGADLEKARFAVAWE
jgi:hypothetical protein